MAQTFADKNEEYWNQAVHSAFKQKWVQDLHAQVSEFLAGNVEWLGLPSPIGEDGRTETKMMDYACGNGIISRALNHLFSKCIGVDLSEGMLTEYRATATELGLTESQMLAVRGNLLAPTVEPTNPPLSEDELNNFDLVVISMALHHVDDVELAVKRLAERLRPGGVLLIIDGAQRSSSGEPHGTASSDNHHDDQSPCGVKPDHSAAHTISHDFFTKEQIFDLFQKAGCGDSSFVLSDRLSDVPGSRTGKMQMFFARATKL